MGLFDKKKTVQTTNVSNSADTYVAGSGVGSQVTGDNSPMLESSFLDQSMVTDSSRQTLTANNGGVVNILDEGAVASAFEFARAAEESNATTYAGMIGWGAQMEQNRAAESEGNRADLYNFAQNAVKQVSDNTRAAFATATGKADPDRVNYLLWGGLGLGLLLLVRR